MKKELIGFIICILIFGSVIKVSGNIKVDKHPLLKENGNTLYVGCLGPGCYDNIQDAINDAVDGDTIFVYNGTYYEHLTIDKSITLLGENRETTFIDGLKEFFTIVKISANSVTVTGFTIQNCNDTSYGGIGIDIFEGDYISINNNIISTSDKSYGNSDGILGHYRPLGNIYINISDNLFTNNDWAIYFINTPFATIQNNIFNNNNAGIHCSGNTKIQNNLLDGCKYIGIAVDGEGNIISKNTISNQKTTGLRVVAGIHLSGSNNQVINNNLINNKRNAICFDTLPWENKCDGNYFDDWIGVKYQQLDFLPYIDRYLFWFIIDWHPASEPYDIGI